MIDELDIFVWVLRRWVGYFFVGRGNLAIKLGEGGGFLLFIKVGRFSFGTPYHWLRHTVGIGVSVLRTLNLIDGYYLGIGFLFASVVG